MRCTSGILKPLQPLPLVEQQEVHLIIQVKTGRIRQSAGLIRWAGPPEELEQIAIDPEFGLNCS
jgi:predicted DNA-binding antitoxin AbrB/MazE fold protein